MQVNRFSAAKWRHAPAGRFFGDFALGALLTVQKNPNQPSTGGFTGANGLQLSTWRVFMLSAPTH
jgi:hypothetical protein